MRRLLIPIGQSLFAGVGLVWLVLEAYYSLSPMPTHPFGFFTSLIIGLVVGIFWFIVNGFWIAGFLKRSIEITSNAIDVTITVLFGDLFKQDGYKVISVNEYFDSAVDDKHVASNSLHGLMLTRYWGGNISDWDKIISQDLASIQPVNIIANRPAPGKPAQYALGTTAAISRGAQDFLCVALAHTDIITLEAYASSDDFRIALRGLLSKARTVCAGRPLNIPLIGSGLSRTGIKFNIIVHLILLAIFEESRTRKITNHIRIVLPKQMKKQFDLHAIQKDWS